MTLDLILSDLTTVLGEKEILQSLEREFISAYGQLHNSLANEHSDIVILSEISRTEQPEDNITILGTLETETQANDQKISGESQVIIDDSELDTDNIDSINILEFNFDSDQASQRINELRSLLQESIAQIQILAGQDEQSSLYIKNEQQRLTGHNQSIVSNYENLTQQEKDEHDKTKAQLSANLNQLNANLQNQNDALKKWWVFPRVFPYFFRGSLRSIERLRQQINSVSSQNNQLDSSLAAMIEWHKTEKEAAKRETEDALAVLDQEYQSRVQTIYQGLLDIGFRCKNIIIPEYRKTLIEWMDHIAGTLASRYPSWENLNELYSQHGEHNDYGIRVGTLISDNVPMEIPAVLDPIGNHKHLFIFGGLPAQRNIILHNLLFRTLTALPVGMIKLSLIDRIDLGSVFSTFVSQLHKDLVGEKVYDHDKEIEEQIQIIRRKTSQITQMVLSKYQSIDDFNFANPDIPMPYHFIVISNFPNGFSQQTLTYLTDIMRNGPRAGIYVIATVSDNLPQRDFDLVKFTSGNYLLQLNGEGTLTWNSEYLSNLTVKADPSFPGSTTPQLLFNITKAYTEKPSSIEYERIARFIPNQWKELTTSGLRAPVGITFGGEVQEIRFNDDVAHGLIGGITGSGKTVLMHDVICGLAQYHSPEELELYLLDFKGTEFDVYAKNKLPHARVVAVDCDPEVGFEIIQELTREMERRKELFNLANVNDIQSYKEKGFALPRILLLIDEVQYAIQKAPNQNIERLLEADLIDLFRRGRSAGIHVLIGTQSPSGVLTASMLQQLKVRICMVADVSVSNLVLGSTNDGATGLQKKGEAVYNENFGLPDLNKFFRAVHLQRDKIAEIVTELSKKGQAIHFSPSKAMFFFTGKSTEKILASAILKAKIDQREIAARRNIAIPLGNAIGPRNDVSFQLTRERYGNVIFLGGGGEDTGSEVSISGTEYLHDLFTNALLALCVQYPVNQCQFFLVDLTSPDSPRSDRLRLFQKMPHEFQFAYNSQVAADILQSVYEISVERKERFRSGKQDEKSIFLSIFGAENFSDLRSGDRYAPSETRKKLEEILKDGPSVGIHTILAAQTLAKGEILKADEFGARVSLRVSEDDSRMLFDSEAGMSVGERRGIFKRREWKKVEKFKFYISLQDEDIRETAKRLFDRENSRM